MKPILDQVMSKVMYSDDGCWLWTGAKNTDGYARISRGGRQGGVARAHRVVYEALVGPVPDDLELDHLCRNRACVRPDHLEPVTHAENMKRGGEARIRRTHCDKGHPYSSNNIYIGTDGRRRCRTCRRDYQRVRYLKKRIAH